jgi:hypothetical protein
VPYKPPPDEKPAALPRFVTLKGTIGDPKSDPNKTAIAVLLARGVSGLVGGRTGDLLNKIGGIAIGAGSSTNGSGTNASPAANLLQGLLGKKDASTNSAATNAPATNPPNLFDLFKKPKK